MTPDADSWGGFQRFAASAPMRLGTPGETALHRLHTKKSEPLARDDVMLQPSNA